MVIDEKYYLEIESDLKKLLAYELDNKICSIKNDAYKAYFTKSDEWDKRKKYFFFDIKTFKKSLGTNPIMAMGEVMIKIGKFVQDKSDDKIQMLSEINFVNQYTDDFRIRIKFISYDMAAKILLNQSQ